MKKTLLTLCSFAFASMAFAQNESDEAIVRRIADNILKQPVTQFVGVKDGKTYNSTKEIPEGTVVGFATPLSEWHYSNGVINMAMVELGELLKEPKYIDYAKNHIAFGFANYEYFKKRIPEDLKEKHWRWPFGQLWHFKELDDCGSMGASVIDVYKYAPKPEYKTYIETAANHITKVQERLADGTLCRKTPRKMTVWADDVYMSVSFLSRMGKFTGNVKYFDDAAKQILQISDLLWDPTKQIYYHCYYTDLQRNGVAYWGRANGWIAVSTAQLLELMPVNHPKRAQLIKYLERQIVGLSRYQDANGMWHQLLDKPDSYAESSATAMFVYSIAKALNNNWIDPTYKSIAIAGWNALKKNQITADGKFSNVCVGTGISDDQVFYYTRPVGDNEKHGLGLVLHTGIEMIKLSKKSSK